MTTRTFHAKSRGGCLRCKASRVKCDEQKPTCLRCQGRNLPCPGYRNTLKWPAKYQYGVVTKDAQGATRHPPSNASTLGTNAHAGAVDPIFVYEGVGCPIGTPDGREISYNEQALDAIFASYPPASKSFGIPLSPTLSDLIDWGPLSPIQLSQQPDANAASPADRLISDEGADPTIREGGVNGSAIETISNIASSSLPAGLTHFPSALCEFFFKEVIRLYCAWDSRVNTMRIITEKWWQHSKPLFHTMQSMGALCLVDFFPHLASVAQYQRHQAIASLHTSVAPNANSEDRLLAAWLLGHTASWHEPDNLAVDFFQESCNIFAESVAQGGLACTSISFFEEAMDYWAMLLAFFTKEKSQNPLRSINQSTSSTADLTGLSTLPHPWTGISRLTVRMMTEVGQLVSRYRSRMSLLSGFLTEKDMEIFRDALRQGRALERSLLNYNPASASSIIDPGDPRTSTRHLQRIDEAYRLTALLQLYRVFPDLLVERYNPWNEQEILSARSASKEPTREEQDFWLTKLAVHILGVLREIPFESGTRCLQPFILVAVASELRCFPSSNIQSNPELPFVVSATTSRTGIFGLDGASDLGGRSVPTADFLDSTMIEVAQARRLVSSKLSAYCHILPLRKIRKIQELVTTIWSALDEGQSDVYWMDIACKKHLCTLMG